MKRITLKVELFEVLTFTSLKYFDQFRENYTLSLESQSLFWGTYRLREGSPSQTVRNTDLKFFGAAFSQKNPGRLLSRQSLLKTLIYLFVNQGVVPGNIPGQKQPPEVFYNKRCSQNLRKIHRKTPVSESLSFLKADSKV